MIMNKIKCIDWTNRILLGILVLISLFSILLGMIALFGSVNYDLLDALYYVFFGIIFLATGMWGIKIAYYIYNEFIR